MGRWHALSSFLDCPDVRDNPNPRTGSPIKRPAGIWRSSSLTQVHIFSKSCSFLELVILSRWRNLFSPTFSCPSSASDHSHKDSKHSLLLLSVTMIPMSLHWTRPSDYKIIMNDILQRRTYSSITPHLSQKWTVSLSNGAPVCPRTSNSTTTLLFRIPKVQHTLSLLQCFTLDSMWPNSMLGDLFCE
jgi:hypothetical protein